MLAESLEDLQAMFDDITEVMHALGIHFNQSKLKCLCNRWADVHEQSCPVFEGVRIGRSVLFDLKA